MLASSELLNSNTEKNDLSTYVTIPLDSLNNPEEHSNLEVVENIFIKQLADGSLYFVYGDEEKQNSVQEKYPEKNGSVSTSEGLNNDLAKNSQTNECTVWLQSPVVLQSVKPNGTKTSSQTDKLTTALKKFVPKKSEQKFRCIKCEDIFENLLLYRAHMKKHRYQKKYKCNECLSGYNIENNYKIHMALVHLKDSKTCPICDVNLTFQRTASLKSHLMLHQTEELYTCDLCDAEFDNEDDFMKHVEAHASIRKKDLRPLTCSYCKVSFEDSKEYRTHISDHVKLKRTFIKPKRQKKSGTIKKENGHVCSVCNKKFIKHSLLERHERIHSGERPFKCQYCDRGFTQKGTLQIHLSRHTGIKPFSCTLCPAKFNQKGNLRVHMQKTHTFPNEGQKMYKCSQCSCIFKKIATLNGHVTKAHLNNKDTSDESIIDKVMSQLKQLEKTTCERLEKDEIKVDSKKNLKKDNTYIEVQLNQIDVADTDFVYLTESTVDGNVRKYFVKQKKIGDIRWYFCNYCTKQFKKPSDLIRHTRVHTREKPFKCKQCKASFSLKSTLICHMKTHKAKPEYKCKLCHLKFHSLRLLNSHLRKHDFESLPKWQCITCGYLFDDMDEGYKHKMEMGQEKQHVIQPYLHHILKQPLYQTAYGTLSFKPPRTRFPNTGSESPVVRPFHCMICDARFTRKVNLRRHIQFHTDDRKFKCSMCPKAFITSYRLTEHMNYHNNIKNHCCKICGKRFVTASLLKRHQIIHNTHRPYQCPYCPKTSKTLLLCRTHIRQVHKKDIIPKLNPLPQSDLQDDTFGNKVLNTNDLTINGRTDIDVGSLQENTSSQDLPTNSENIIQQLLPTTSSIQILNSTSDNSSLQDQNYQTIYIDINDLPFLENSNLNLGNTALQSQLKIQTVDPILTNSVNDLQENIIFSLDSVKSDLNLPPVEIFSNSCSENVDIPNNTNPLPSIAEITTKNIKLNSFTDKNLSDKSTSLSTLLENNSNLYPNVTFADELSLPINVTDGDILDSSSTIFQPITSTNLNETEDLNDGNIMCVNCNQLFMTMDIFEHHSCSVLNDHRKTETVTFKTQNLNEKNENVENISTNEKQIDDKVKNFFDCVICKKVIKGRKMYIRHLASHTASKQILLRTCKFCFKDFKKPSDLKRHLRTHTGEKPFNCDVCDKKFSLKSTLDSHIRTHNPSHKQFNCDICNSFFSSKSSLKVHMTIHTGQKSHSCKFCNIKFRTAGNRKSHEQLMHLSKSKKVNEGKRTKIKNTLQTAASEIINEMNKNIPVEDSGQITKENSADDQVQIEETQEVNLLTAHENLLPSLAEDQIVLDPMSLLQQLQMSGMIITNDSDTTPLLVDDITLLNIEGSKDNIQIMSLPQPQTQSSNTVNTCPTKTEKIRNLECDICHKFYASKDVLRKHKKNVHGDKNLKFPCIKCDKKFKSQDELNKHVKLHNGYRPFPCTYCANSFMEEQSLKTHIKRIHQHETSSVESTSMLVNMKYPLLSSNIEDPLFSNLFAMKKIE